jgi:hypothetical protein
LNAFIKINGITDFAVSLITCVANSISFYITVFTVGVAASSIYKSRKRENTFITSEVGIASSAVRSARRAAVDLRNCINRTITYASIIIQFERSQTFSTRISSLAFLTSFNRTFLTV